MGKVDKFVDEHSTTIITGGAIAVFWNPYMFMYIGHQGRNGQQKEKV